MNKSLVSQVQDRSMYVFLSVCTFLISVDSLLTNKEGVKELGVLRINELFPLSLSPFHFIPFI